MTHRRLVFVLAVILVLFLTFMLGVRAALRDLALPFTGLERLALQPRFAHPTEEEEIRELVRTIDWEDLPAPAPAPQVRKAKPPAARTILLQAALADGQELTELAFTSVRVTALKALAFRVVPDTIDSLAHSLGLSASQKERISAWMDWRKQSLEGLGDAEKAAIEEVYETAVSRELDHEQREKYQEMKNGSTGGRFALVLQEQSTERTQSTALSEWLKSMGTEK